ncbi:ATP-dependent RecD-like DNA helicase [Pararhizobium sp. BT-229]|uniref:ATP-dependent RecD-like DNA helicase n=1 Tax=Pararhizobium sp. BT-229 TaxID=2986923 RepID=UPI0021F7C828|nr:ATP-dependent RecD-like DNA helicase [Pararhizobium sp. BT-229]MCV9963759.1 ATP-dependent RecD-like DNA helicase [Pararhizobium sp. BT-229]
MEEYRGFIREIRRTFEPSGDVLADAEIESRAGMVPMVVVGPFKSFVREGDWFIASGKTKPNTFNGRTENRFKAYEIRPDLPRTKAGALAMLDKTFNDNEHGIDLSARHRFVEKHGADTAFKIEKNPDLLLEMTDDANRFGRAIRNAWSSRVYNLQPIRIMEGAGAKPETIAAVMKKYRDETLDIIKNDPYELMSVKGVDFGLADKFAEKVGIGKNDQRRVSAAVSELVSASLSDGNTYIPVTVPEMKAALKPFGIEWDAFKKLASTVMTAEHAERLGVTIFQSKVGNVIQKIETYRNERDIATAVAALVARGATLDHQKIDEAAKRVLAQEKFSFLSAEQREAVINSSRESIAILTGGPGTGKSTVSDAIAEIAVQTIKGPLYLVAPTGKAARRLAETTERDAQTVHKLLGAKGKSGSFKFGRHNKLEKGCFVLVDESSMLDTALTKALLDALPEDGRILFVGDKDQLPSVDAGYVLGDMLTARAQNGNMVPSSELTEVFRSKGANNMIAPYAKEIKEGVFDVSKVTPATIWSEGVAFFDFPKESIVVQVEKVYCDLAERVLNLSPRNDVVVLCPMRKGRGGTHEINTRLQAKANPKGEAIKGWVRPSGMDRAEPTPRVGDRVMLTANDDDLNIRNGDVGYIKRVVTEWDGKRSFDAVEVVLESDDVVRIPVTTAPYNMIVAYAITGHKSQGSQYKCVIMPVSEDHTSMMERTLLYTEWTRAKRFVVLIGNKDVFTAGIENVSSSRRMTLLKSHIEDELDLLPARPRRRPAPSASAPRAAAPPAFTRPSFARPSFGAPQPAGHVAPPPRTSNPFSAPLKR